MKTLTAFLLLASLACGFDLTTTEGSTYSDIRLLEKNDGGIRFAHSTGVASLNYRKMQPDDARTFGYDEAKFEAWLKKMMGKPAESEATTRPQPAAAFPAARPARSYVAPAPREASVTTSGTARSQCAAYTKKGYRCSRMAAAGSTRCWQH